MKAAELKRLIKTIEGIRTALCDDARAPGHSSTAPEIVAALIQSAAIDRQTDVLEKIAKALCLPEAVVDRWGHKKQVGNLAQQLVDRLSYIAEAGQ